MWLARRLYRFKDVFSLGRSSPEAERIHSCEVEQQLPSDISSKEAMHSTQLGALALLVLPGPPGLHFGPYEALKVLIRFLRAF